jgi:hypothetical protein
MSTETTDDINEAIAIFDEWQFLKGDPSHKCNFCFAGDEPCTPAVDRFVKGGRIVFHYDLKYHASWEWLMPVVEKIESLENIRFGFTIDVLHVIVTDYKGKGVEIIWVHKFPDNGDTKLSMTYDAVHQFIQWYNQNKNL